MNTDGRLIALKRQDPWLKAGHRAEDLAHHAGRNGASHAADAWLHPDARSHNASCHVDSGDQRAGHEAQREPDDPQRTHSPVGRRDEREARPGDHHRHAKSDRQIDGADASKNDPGNEEERCTPRDRSGTESPGHYADPSRLIAAKMQAAFTDWSQPLFMRARATRPDRRPG